MTFKFPEHRNLEDIQLFTLPREGTDKLKFKITETIEVPNVGEDTFDLVGSFEIRRENPTHPEWGRGAIDVTMLNLDVSGESRRFGPISARLNADEVTSGKVDVADSRWMSAKCSFAAFVQINLEKLELRVFNRESVPLVHRITHVPPIGQGGGTPGPVAIDFYNVKEPEGKPVAILREVRTQIGSYVQ